MTAAQLDSTAIAGSRLFGLGIAATRIFFGLVFLANGLAKFIPVVKPYDIKIPFGFLIDTQAAREIIQFEAARNPIKLYSTAIKDLVLPNWSVFGPLVGALETGAGLLLLIGFLTPVAALVAAGLILHLQFATLWNNKWLFEYSVEWLPLLGLAAVRAGRWYGLDRRFAVRRARPWW